MSKFKVGDRVKDTTRFAGKLGTVIGFSGFNDVPLVEYDDAIPGGHYGNASVKTGRQGKNGHCWYAEDGVKLVLTNSTPRNWKLVIAPDKSNTDVTNATMYNDGKVVRIDSVRRYHKDAYNIDAAITAVLAKRNVECPKVEAEPAKGVVEVARPAKAGEWIKVVDPKVACGRYKAGDVMQVITREGSNGVRCGDFFLWACEYVVLENYELVKSEPPKPEPAKPIMIGGVELKAGSGILLKPYNEDAACGMSEGKWNRFYNHALLVKRVSCGTHVVFEDPDKNGLTWRVKLEAVDRVLSK